MSEPHNGDTITVEADAPVGNGRANGRPEAAKNGHRNVRDAALAALAERISVAPPKEDGTKGPDGPWKELQERRATLDEVNGLYGTEGTPKRSGVGAVMGRVSENMECFELDGRGVSYGPFKAAAVAIGLGELIERIEAGYSERTPTGGFHWLYRCECISGNTVLARYKSDEINKKTGKPVYKPLIETRGEGGYVVLAPSNGRVHPSGGAYELLRGGFDTIATIAAEERIALWDLARTFDEAPQVEPSDKAEAKARGESRGGWDDGDVVSPIDAYNEQAAWPDILPAGWRLAYQHGDTEYWCRAGKGQGVSATINRRGSGRLYVFSTSTEFEAQVPYTKFAAYAHLNHGGDFKAAVRALSQAGYGTFKAWVKVDDDWVMQTLPNPCPTGGHTRIAKPGEGPPERRRGRKDRGEGGGQQGGADGDQQNEEQPQPVDRDELLGRIKAIVEKGGYPALFDDDQILHDIVRLEAEAENKYAGLVASLRGDRKFPLSLFYKALKPARLAMAAKTETIPTRTSTYVEAEDGYLLLRELESGPVFEKLSNFTARITHELTKDEGDRQTKHFRIEAKVKGRTLTIDVPAAEFAKAEWIGGGLGGDAAIWAGLGFRDHVRSAIQFFSPDIAKRTTFLYTGWRECEGEYSYLHAGGAIGAKGNDPNVSVELRGKLAGYHLPDPPDDAEALRLSVRSVLRMLKLADGKRPHSRTIAAASICIPFRAVLGDPLSNIWADGLTGALKTEWAANLMLRFWGTGFSRDNVPGSWTTTDNALEIQAHQAKDVVFLIDDYRPPENPPAERNKYEARASRVLRSAANRQGRDRAKPDGTLQTTKYPRGLLLATAETTPPDTSVIGRTLILEFVPEKPDEKIAGTLDKGLMRELTADAAAGKYALAMSAFIRWLAPQYPEVRASLRPRADRRGDELRQELIAQNLHPRTPEAVADLALGFEEFARFAVEVGAITEKEAELARKIVGEGLRLVAFEQPAHQQNTDPITRFFDLLHGSTVQGSAFLANTAGEAPRGIESACGWLREEPFGNGINPRWYHGQTAKKFGWVKDDKAFILPDSAYGIAQELASRQGSRLPFTHHTLARSLKAKGLLLASERSKNTVKRHVEGRYERVWELPLKLLVDQAASSNDLGSDETESVDDHGSID